MREEQARLGGQKRNGTKAEVIDLAEFKNARTAAGVLDLLLSDRPWLLNLFLIWEAKAGFEIQAIVDHDDAEVQARVPVSVDGVPVRIVVHDPPA